MPGSGGGHDGTSGEGAKFYSDLSVSQGLFTDVADIVSDSNLYYAKIGPHLIYITGWLEIATGNYEAKFYSDMSKFDIYHRDITGNLHENITIQTALEDFKNTVVTNKPILVEIQNHLGGRALAVGIQSLSNYNSFLVITYYDRPKEFVYALNHWEVYELVTKSDLKVLKKADVKFSNGFTEISFPGITYNSNVCVTQEYRSSDGVQNLVFTAQVRPNELIIYARNAGDGSSYNGILNIMVIAIE